MTHEILSEMQRLFNEFEKRPIYKTLNIAIINSIKDEDLTQAIIDNIQTKFSTDFSNEDDILRSLSTGQKAIYVT